MKRIEVYGLIDGERDYQNKERPEPRPLSDADTPVAAWILYMEEHLYRAKQRIYYLKEKDALQEIRKVAALGVACMEYNNTQPREETEK